MPEILFFPYYGPGRRSDKRVVELRLDFSSENEFAFPKQIADIKGLLIDAFVLSGTEIFPAQPCPPEPMAWYATLLVQTALLFQQKTGHRVDFFSVSCDADKKHCIALVEHEHSAVGMAAVGLAIEVFSGKMKSLTESFNRFSAFARARALPRETAAIIGACRNRGIPFLQLDREPLADKTSIRNRIRRNGLLSLGHGLSNRVLDGTYCLDRGSQYLIALRRNPGQRSELLRQLGILHMPNQAARVSHNDLYHLLAINGKVTAVHERADGSRQPVDAVHASLIGHINVISEKVNGQLLLVTVQTSDLNQPLLKTGGMILDFELAPNLHKLFADCDNAGDLLNSSAGDLVDGLFPSSDQTRIPVVAVTGTNGKTTTSRMICHIFQTSAYKPALVCSDGIYLDQRQVSKGDGSAFIGHARALTSTQIDAAVLETHHRGIAVRGFAFDHCNVAVCLNVTGDHLIKGEIETLEEMTAIKRALLERARDGAVLNGDDLQCLTMLPVLEASRVCLFSSTQSKLELAKTSDKTSVYCIVEERTNEAWVMIYDDGKSHALLPVSSMPCTFAGAARFNLENALAAISACYLLGIPLLSIGHAMRLFTMGFDNTPGRLNYYDKLPFTAVVDYAHNPDGIARLSEFAAALPVKGRRLIMLAGPGDRSDEGIGDMARAAAGKFDHYVCRHYNNTRGRGVEEVPKLLKAAFLEAGVSETAISIEPDPSAAIDYILNMAGPADLVILTVDHKEFEATNRRLFAMQGEQL